MLDYAFDIMCLVLGFSLGYSYLGIWVYVDYIDDVISICDDLNMLGLFLGACRLSFIMI